MNEVVKDTASFAGDPEAFIPDGWDGKSVDDFSDVELTDEELFGDGLETEPELSIEDEGSNSEVESAPTTGDEADVTGPDADAVQSTNLDGGAGDKGTTSRILKLKVNHKDEEFDVGKASDEDLIALIQKGKAFDAMKEAENKKLYREVYQEQIDAGMTEYVAKLVAKEAVDGKTYSLTDDEPAEPQVEAPNNRASNSEIEELKRQIAELKAQSSQTAASLKKENRILKQNAAAAAKAPVSGVSGGGDATPKKVDNFIKGFDSDPW